MVKFNDKTIASIYNETTVIGKIFKGTLKVYESWRNLIKNGVPPLTLEKCKGVDLIDYKLYGNSVQEGTPTTEAPIEIESVGDKSKNLLPFKNGINFTVGGINYYIKGCELYVNGTSIGETYRNNPLFISNFSFKLKAGTYTMYRTNTERIMIYLSRVSDNANLVTLNSDTSLSVTFTLEEDTVVNLGFYTYQMSFNNVKLEIMLERNDKETGYEISGYKIPIKVSNDTEGIITNIYLDEPLRKIGDYVDYIDFEKQKVYRNVQVIDDTGTLPIEESLKGVIDNNGTLMQLPNIPTIKGTTILSVDTEIQPSNMEVVYKGKEKSPEVELTISKIEQLLVSYFETKTIKEVER